ncbi:MAG: CehA/McbA family metallohydrolase, partial [Verrucomicrobiaceae bacterium]
VVQAMRSEKTGTLKIKVSDSDEQPVSSARVMLEHGNSKIPGYTDANGVMTLQMPAGKHKLSITDMGRPDCGIEAQVKPDESTEVTAKLDPASRLDFVITGENGRAIPCKAQILATGDTKPLDLGPATRAHGCRDQYHSENGHFSLQVPPGSYRIVVTHGIEFSHHEQDVTLEQGNNAVIKAMLKRMVDTKGWISADFHNHSTPSGDNVCGTPDRIINIAAENIEFAPTTEHNRIYDWRPFIEELGLHDEIQTVTGMELTGSATHLNCFPLKPEPFTQDNGAPVWHADPRISALTLRGWQGEREDRWVQVNHPDLSILFNDRNLDGQADGGFTGIESMVNGMETENGVLGGGGDILAESPWKLTKAKGALATKVEYLRQFIWLQLLNLGYRITPLAVADAHSVFGNGVGGWRMYLPSKTDDPAKIDWSGDLMHHAKAGHIVLTTGPFLQVTTGDGKMPGDDAQAANGRVELHVKVQCTDWQDIDRVQVLVNGRKEPSLNFTRQTHPGMFADGLFKFDQTITVPLKSDAHLIVVATHETMTLKTGYGSSDQAGLHPMVYHAPIYIDVDGNGFQANHDTLGFEIPVAKMTPDMVREKLGKPAESETKNEETAAPPAKLKKSHKKKA